MQGRGHDGDRGGEARREDRAVYIISVAAELAGVHPQTLRIYERKGLVRPKRTSGNTRRYSDRDIELLRQIQDLTQDRGINLAGVKMVIEMQAELEALRRRTEELEERLRISRRAARRAAVRDAGSQIVPLHQVVLPPWEGSSGGPVAPDRGDGGSDPTGGGGRVTS
ncbi:MAG TPA: helix-turn-helix transcriptional regulator [Actinomycetota bacterium]|jgi:MerR family transcriptional regulator/heat shock protein HspR